MITIIIVFANNVKEKGADPKVKGFVVEEEFTEKAKILAVDFIVLAIDFKDRDAIVPINLTAWGVSICTIRKVVPQTGTPLHVF